MKKLLITGAAVLALMAAMVGCTGTSNISGPIIDSITAELVSAGATGNMTVTGMEGMSVRVDLTVSNFEVVDTIGGAPTATVEGASGYFIYYLERQSSVTQPGQMTPTPTPSPGPTMSPTPSPTASPTPTVSPAPTGTPTPTGTAGQPTPTMSPTATPTLSPTPTGSPAPAPTSGAGQQTVAFASTDTRHTWEDLEPGLYVFWVQLVDADGEPLMPAVMAAAALTVPEMEEEPAPTATTPIPTTTPTGTITPTGTATPTMTP